MPRKKNLSNLTQRDHLLIDYILLHPEMSELACVVSNGWAKGSQGKVLARIRPLLDERRAKMSEKIDKAVVKKAVLNLELLDDTLLEVITSAPHEKRGRADIVSGLRMGYPRIGVHLSPSPTQVNMQNIINPPQIYQSAWLKKAPTIELQGTVAEAEECDDVSADA